VSTFFIIVFFATLFLCFTTYVLYPVCIWIVGKVFPFTPHRKEITPTVSIIIPAYNEAMHIREKVENTMALDYPEEKVEILVGSDGSDDGMGDLMKGYLEGKVHFVEFKTNRGKTTVQNDLVELSKGEILIFTDAASFLSQDAVRKIIRNFADERVGCVAGSMRFDGNARTLTTESQQLYWRYESKIRHLESRIGSLIGVDGPLYAVRRSSFVPLEHYAISDFIMPLKILEQGKKVVLEPEAVVEESPTLRGRHEFATRRRITLRGLVGLAMYKDLLSPFRGPWLCLQIIAHKVLRWFVGPLVILNAGAALFLSDIWFFKAVVAGYLCLLLGAILGLGMERLHMHPRVLIVPYYFALVNLAGTMGIVDFFRKKQAVTWKPVR
jgi:cellulose synthase/poly-beta-1,6-N-acetylglucosamine synthase-like glycosyltransferase